MASQTLRDELNNLTGSAELDSYTPQPMGGSTITSLTKDTERLSLSETFQLLDSAEVTEGEDKNIGTLLSRVSDSIVEADNKVCGV